jgi:hypothetical protein
LVCGLVQTGLPVADPALGANLPFMDDLGSKAVPERKVSSSSIASYGTLTRSLVVRATSRHPLTPCSSTMTTSPSAVPPLPLADDATGRPSLWSKAQKKVIKSYVPVWHRFAIDDRRDVRGRSAELASWKKTTADAILECEEFKILPQGVSYFYLPHKPF